MKIMTKRDRTYYKSGNPADYAPSWHGDVRPVN